MTLTVKLSIQDLNAGQTLSIYMERLANVLNQFTFERGIFLALSLTRFGEVNQCPKS